MDSFGSGDINFVNMNATLDEFIAEYFDKESIKMPHEDNTTRARRSRQLPVIRCQPQRGQSAAHSSSSALVPKTKTSTPLANPVSNFSLGESSLFEDSFNNTQYTTFGGSDADTEGESGATKVVSIRTSRRSMSYDIVFNPDPKKEAQIAIQIRTSGTNNKTSATDAKANANSRRVPDSRRLDDSGASSGSTTATSLGNGASLTGFGLETQYDQHLKKIVSSLKAKNEDLEEEVRNLMDKLAQAQKTIGQLEVEVANFFSRP